MKRLLPGWLGAPRLDPTLLLLLLLVIVSGLLVLYSASGQNMAVVERQALRLGFGVAVMLAISQVPPRILRMWTPWLYGMGILMLVATLFVGVGRGTQRWLDFGLFRFQPSELMKLAVPMMVAWFLHSRILPPNWRFYAVPGRDSLANHAGICRHRGGGGASDVVLSQGVPAR